MQGEGLVQAGEVAIDPETGEVVGWSAAVGTDEVEYLARLCAEAKGVIDEQQRVYDAARKALEQILLDRGEQSIKTAYGTPSLSTQNRRTGRPERVAEIVRQFELSRDQEQLIWMCATALDAKELDDLAQARLLPREAVEELIEVKTISSLRFVLPRGSGPASGRE
jgi:hypothetical protein